MQLTYFDNIFYKIYLSGHPWGGLSGAGRGALHFLLPGRRQWHGALVSRILPMGRDIPGVPGSLLLLPTPPLENMGGRKAEAADH